MVGDDVGVMVTFLITATVCLAVGIGAVLVGITVMHAHLDL
jgi:hypothetical protein